MARKPECTCAEDDWRGARGHINLTLNGHWPLSESEKYVQCDVCGRFVHQDYADGRKKALDREPLYTSPAEWYAALAKGTAYRVGKAAAVAAGKAAKADA